MGKHLQNKHRFLSGGTFLAEEPGFESRPLRAGANQRLGLFPLSVLLLSRRRKEEPLTVLALLNQMGKTSDTTGCTRSLSSLCARPALAIASPVFSVIIRSKLVPTRKSKCCLCLCPSSPVLMQQIYIYTFQKSQAGRT